MLEAIRTGDYPADRFRKIAPAITLPLDGLATADISSAGPHKPDTSFVATVATRDGVRREIIGLPEWEFFSLNRYLARRRIGRALGIHSKHAPILFTALPQNFSSTDLLPGRLTARTFDNSPRFINDHIRNLENLTATTIESDSLIVFNMVDAPHEASGRVKKKWIDLHNAFDTAAKLHGVTVESAKAHLLEELDAGRSDVVILISHGDHSSVHLLGGERLTVEEVLAMAPSHRARPPIVIMLACETGRSFGSGATSIAEALMLRGRASAILAPVRPISAKREALPLLHRLLKDSPNIGDLIRALDGPWQAIVENAPPANASRNSHLSSALPSTPSGSRQVSQCCI